MKRRSRVLLVLALVSTSACDRVSVAFEREDPLTAEIESSREQVKPKDQPALARAEEDLHAGRRLLAVQRFAGIKENLAVAAYLGQHRAGQLSDFEAEWQRMGGVLQADLGKPSPQAFKDVEPAAVRALAEAALPQIRGYYEASLEYGRNTMPDQGLYYLAGAQAQRDLTAFYRKVSEPTSRQAPPVRSLHAELDALETDLLTAYRPPASIEKHGQFIGASSTLKEARELDAAGLQYGALLRYLQAARQLAAIRPAAPLGADALARRMKEIDARLSAGKVDHSLGRLFLESAQSGVEDAGAVVQDVLPRYFAALEPGKPERAGPAPSVTVTLVRWPYT
ncbi:MAG TPA: hypothetical protein VH394_12335 [Thermoanaerobaculia bacterium]|nr:hypothetical protein [Thermoanaerobaculia bacterium]